MRRRVIPGVVLLTALVAGVVAGVALIRGPDRPASARAPATTETPAAPAVAAAPAPLSPLDVALGRPLVLYIDGAVSSDVYQTLAALDAPIGALAAPASPRSLLDLDVYVMVRDSWTVFAALEGHDLAPLIRTKAQGQGPNAGAAWFEADLAAPDGAGKSLLVILATRPVLGKLGEFCFAVTVYDLARFARNGRAFVDAMQGPGSYWKQCPAQGWTRIADVPAER